MTKNHVTTKKTRTRTTTLTPLEEKVVRMRRGLRAPENLVLERQGAGHPEAEAMLAEIEERALKMVGARNSATKRKIVDALKKKR